MHRAFDALLHHGARHLVRLVDVAVVVVIVGAAPARTDELGKAVLALPAREQAGRSKPAADRRIEFSLENAAHTPFRIARKLMARVDIAIGYNGKVFVPRAARRDALLQAGAAL